MSSSHSALITGTPFRLGAVHADCSVRRGSNAESVTRTHTRTRAAFERRFRLTDPRQLHRENDIRLEERRRERTRIVHELHDTLLQGFLGASMLLDQAVEQTPADSPSKPALSRALVLVRRAVDEGRKALRGLPMASIAPATLEEAFSELLDEVMPGRGVQVRLFVQGRARALNPTIQEQLFLIGREAFMNALRHSQATKIDVEVEYTRDLLHMLVRDNGCGIEPEKVQKSGDWHWGLRGMCERAENIGAQFDVRSSPGEGTEVRVGVPVDGAKSIQDLSSWDGRSEV
jgi:signal transduction histidine kinase